MVLSVRKHGLVQVLCLSVGLLVSSLGLAAPVPIGSVIPQGDVRLGTEALPAQSVIYSGDQLSTYEGQATLSLPHGNLLVLEQYSRLKLEMNPSNGLQVGLEKGQLALTVSPRSAIRVEADGLTVTASGAFPSLAEISLRADGSLVVAVHQGAVSIANLRAEPMVVTSGQSITVAPRLADAQENQTVGTAAHGKMTLGEKWRTFRIGHLSHAASATLLVGGIAALAAAAIIVPYAIKTHKISPSLP